MHRRVVCIIQCRLGSSRLPQKALADICGRPMIWHVVDRARQITEVDEVCVATVPADVPKLEFAIGGLARVYAPALPDNDVLARYSWVKTRLGANVVVRITADCPLLDPEKSWEVLATLLESDYEYVTNRSEMRDGWDTEAVTARALHRADDEATSEYDREHVTSYIYNHPELFRCKYVDQGAIGEKLSVDTEADLELVRRRMCG